MLPATQSVRLFRTFLQLHNATKIVAARTSSENNIVPASLLARFSTEAPTTVVPFALAQTGEGISECELLQWFVEEGQEVEAFGKVCEVQSDKATIEITSRYSGRIVKLYHQPGDLVKVGATLVDVAVVEATGAAEGTSQDGPATASASEEPVTPGGSAATEPDAVDATAAAAGTAAGPGQEPVGRAAVLAAPAVRRLAKDLGVALAAVQGSGPGGRVVKEDVLRAAGHQVDDQRPPAPATPDPTSPAATTAAPVVGALPPEVTPLMPALEDAALGPTVVPIRGYRRAMVRTMSEAATIPHFHFMEEVDVGPLVRVRRTLKDHRAASGTCLTLLPLLVKALSVALRGHPTLNASLAPGGQQLLLHASHNVGVAMATPTGLVVPNIKQVERKSVLQIARELEQLRAAAQQGRLSPEQLSGGTITVSNIGTIGGTYATPLVNPPEVAIVAIGRVRQALRLEAGGKVEAVPVMNVSWGADHRVVDGAALAAFCGEWKALLEEPAMLLLHLH